MATAAGRRLTDRHRAGQLAVRAATLRQLLVLWPLWRLDDPSTFDGFAAAAASLIAAGRRDSAALAASYYQDHRRAEDAAGQATARPAGVADRDKVTAALVVTGSVTVARALRSGRTPAQAKDSALVGVSGAVTKLTLDAGRDTIVRSVAADPQARGWQRVTSATACAFCRMLAAEGPDHEDAGFRAHASCGCAAEPVYGAWAPTAQQATDRQLWGEATQGLSGGDARNAFRRAVGENRGGSVGRGGGGGGPPSRPVPGDAEPDRHLPGASRLTVAQRARLPRRDQLPAAGKQPPTVEQLRDEGRVGDSDEHFLPGKHGDADREVAAELRRRGADVRSVRRIERLGERNPDAVVGGAVTEFKTPASSSDTAMYRTVRGARAQARIVVVDCRAAGTIEADALEGLANALRMGGGDLDEVLIMGRGFDLHWTP